MNDKDKKAIALDYLRGDIKTYQVPMFDSDDNYTHIKMGETEFLLFIKSHKFKFWEM